MRHLLAALLPLTALAADQPYARFDESARLWTIGNDTIETAFRLEPEGWFRFLYIAGARSTVWYAPSSTLSGPIALTASNVNLDANALYDLDHWATSPTERGGIRLTIRLEPRQVDAHIRFEAEAYPDQPFLRYRSFLENTGGGALRVSAADMLPWRFHSPHATLRAFLVGQWSWAGNRANFEPHEYDLAAQPGPVEAFTGAYGDHSTWGAVRDPSDNGIVFGWEFDGRARAHAEMRDGMLEVDALIMQIDHEVRPGEEFLMPGAFLGLFRGDWDEAGFRTQRFVEAVLAKPIPEPQRFPFLMFDSWGFQWSIDDQVLREAARRSAELGVEVFTVDFGWARVTGDWTPDPVKFPNGLRPLSDYVRSLGMKFGLHLPFGEALEEAQVFRLHPDWKVVPNPNQQRGYFGARGICLSHRPAREWVIAEILRVIRENGVDWLLQDGENMVKGCFATNHTHAAGDSNYANSIEGLNAIIEAVQKQEPDVLWENCEDGGNMQTFHMVQHYVTSIVNDNDDHITTRRSIYGSTYPFPPRYTDRYMESDPWTSHITRSHFFGGPLILMQPITQWSDPMLAFMKKELAIYKSTRTLIRDAKIYHLTPPPDGSFNDYLQAHHQETDRSVIFVFREHSEEDLTQVRPRGLTSARLYTVRFEDHRATHVLSGSELMENGIPVPLLSAPSAEIVYIDPAPEGVKPAAND
ncbi:MAG: alpha-galactosidase [Bryobacteraceae bacterium]